MSQNLQQEARLTNRSLTVGSVCSGIEAASVAWKDLGFGFEWFSEISDFPSKILKEKYPSVPNLGDMTKIPNLIETGSIPAPDIVCGGTPCQAFSYAGWQQGLKDDRGNLTLKFVDIANANDDAREAKGLKPCVILWENVEGVLSDKTNAFGFFVSALAGLAQPLEEKQKWPSAGLVRGERRTVAWRVLDARYFGLPQRRRRLYVIAGSADLHPESILFEMCDHVDPTDYIEAKGRTVFMKDGHRFEVFREYTDCLYSSYATKWNGNAAANNGSLFVVQDGSIRRFSPLECERLMGFPDGYTEIEGARKSSRYQALGNSWAVPVIKWIGERMVENGYHDAFGGSFPGFRSETGFYDLSAGTFPTEDGGIVNCGIKPSAVKLGDLRNIVSHEKIPDIYLSPVGCAGILRRKGERCHRMNPHLEASLKLCASKMPEEEIERRSRVQSRGKYSELQKAGQ